MMAQVFISIGSNLGDRMKYLERAVAELSSLPSTTVERCSSVYETEPVGVTHQPVFLNMAAELDSRLAPLAVLRGCKEIEQKLGRTNREHWGPREIDLDLLYYGSETIETEELRLPHPEMRRRKFVLIPLNEIGAGFRDPVTETRVSELLAACPDAHAVHKIAGSIFLSNKE